MRRVSLSVSLPGPTRSSKRSHSAGAKAHNYRILCSSTTSFPPTFNHCGPRQNCFRWRKYPMPEPILEPNCAYSQTVSSRVALLATATPGLSPCAPHRRTSRQSYRMPAAPVNWRSVAPLHRLDVTGIKSQVLCRTVLGVGKTITRQAQRNSETHQTIQNCCHTVAMGRRSHIWLALSFFHSTSRGLRWFKDRCCLDPGCCATRPCLCSQIWVACAGLSPLRSAGSPSNLPDWKKTKCWTSKFPCSWRHS